jgi:hypothetical protein
MLRQEMAQKPNPKVESEQGIGDDIEAMMEWI